MKSIQKLRKQKAELAAKAKKLIEDNGGDKWTDAHQADYDGTMAQIKAVNSEIERHQALIADAGDILDVENEDIDAASVAGRAANSHIQVQAKRVYRNIGEQMQDVQAMTQDTSEAPRARDRFQKVVNASGASTGIDSDGGYLVETDKATDIMQTAVETGALSSRCTRQPIGANSDSFEYLAFKDRDRSAGTMLGGIQVYRKAESSLMASSGKAVLEPRELRLEDMYGLIYVTNRMLRDAVAMANYTKQGLRNQLSWKLDLEIWQGTGSGQCLGITNSDLLVSVAAENAQTTDTINAANLVKMLARFKGNLQKAAWFTNQDCLPQFPLLTMPGSTAGVPIFLPGGSLSGAPLGTLLGIPIVPIEFASTIGDVYDIMLADFSEYMLIEKGGVEESESMHVRYLYDEMCFRFIARNNGQPMHESPITPYKGSNTLSPFVTLATR
ncbi:MAG TPA: phage major capsid protein [Verrucomicrobia bacterium]|nr:phage major capsid protein [Verrucomicrobiota bacterium]